MLQTSLIFPGRSSQGRRDAIVPASRDGDYELIRLTTKSGVPIVAVFGTALADDGAKLTDPYTRPTILLFYGNGMCLADAMSWFRDFRKLGANVMIPDYAGYGMSGGKPSEASFYQTGDACWDYLASRQDIDDTRLVPTGVSIGGAVALHLAAQRPAAAVALFSPFTSLDDMAREVAPFLPTSLLLRHHFPNEKIIRQVRVPTFIAHGRGDRIIPFRMSERLKAAAAGPVTFMPVDTDHNDLFELAGDELLARLGEFLRKNIQHPGN
jgi:fermentation-respiration switch protein FrsA (DUF1100 family)